MPSEDPFAPFGLTAAATLDELRAARRRLAKQLHPDHGGDEAGMQELNRAFELAVKAKLRPPEPAPPPSGPRRDPERMRRMRRWVDHDHPSFSIEALPAEAFEALLVATNWLGEVLVDDPPYVLEVHLHDPGPCWCRLELYPEAGASMVNLTVVGSGHVGPPTAEEVRDAYVAALNQLGSWDPFGGDAP